MAAGSILSPGIGGAGSLSTETEPAGTTALADLGASSDQVVVTGNLTSDGDLTVSDSGSFGHFLHPDNS